MNVMEDDKMIELWHQRLSHMGGKGLDYLGNKDILSCFKQSKLIKSPFISFFFFFFT